MAKAIIASGETFNFTTRRLSAHVPELNVHIYDHEKKSVKCLQWRDITRSNIHSFSRNKFGTVYNLIAFSNFLCACCLS